MLGATAVVPLTAGRAPLVVLTESVDPGTPARWVAEAGPVDPAAFHTADEGTHEVAGGRDASGGLQLTLRENGDDAEDADDQPMTASGALGGGLSECLGAVLLTGAGLLLHAGCRVVAEQGRRRGGRSAALVALPEAPTWARSGRTVSRELAVVTLQTHDDLDLQAFERTVEAFAGTVLAATDTTVSVALTGAPVLVDDAVARFRALAQTRVQRSGPLCAPLGPALPRPDGPGERPRRPYGAA
ncbi:hypothetical protein [Quadrisphaera sp. KR29]|uniref:hypothetical protein n=1 Tax=Quadrisphaera sp. KR29 TaxID=3461391 RepID=UPI004043BD20